MKSRILHTSYIIDFLEEGFSTISISNTLKSETDDLFQKLGLDKVLKDWEVLFKAVYNNCDKILVFSKTKSYVIEKQKEIVIHVPIPSTDEQFIKWGVRSDNLGKLLKLRDVERFAFGLEVDYSLFESRQAYIFDCLRRGIRASLEKGFTLNNIKVKELN